MRKKNNDGLKYERHCKRKMRLMGYFFIRPTPETGDYGADLIARDIFMRKVVVQCKNYSHPVGIAAVQEVYAAKSYYGAYKAVVASSTTFTKSAINLARKTGVKLWRNF